MRANRYPLFPIPVVGSEMAIPPNDDTCGGRAIVHSVEEGVSGDELVHFVIFVVGQDYRGRDIRRGINWEQFFSKSHSDIKRTYGDRKVQVG